MCDEKTDELRQCKRCLLLQSNDIQNYKDVVDHIKKIPSENKSDDELYTKRLDICKECDELVSGTCLKCGCYVEFRAAFKKNKCPMKKW